MTKPAAVLLAALFGFASIATAETNLAWVPASATGNRDIGAWRIPSDLSLVVSGSDWAMAAIVPFGPLSATAPVWTCTGDVLIGSDTGCLAQGFGLKSQVRQSAPASPPPPVWAEGQAILSWVAPTTRVDGSPITGTLSYHIETSVGVAVATTLALTYTATGLTAGEHCWRVMAIEGSLASAPSTVACKTVVEDVPPPPPPPPLPPAVVVVPNVAGLSHAIVFGITVTSTGATTRGSTVLGFVPVGTVCEGAVVYKYRAQDYRRLPQSAVIWWTSTPTVNAAAACR